MSRIPRAGLCLILIAAGAVLIAAGAGAPALRAQEPARAERPPTPGADLTIPTTDRAARRAEDDLARALVRLDEDLGLGTFPDASPEWPARLVASIEARAGDAPGQGLLRDLAAELGALGFEWTLGARPDEAPGTRPSISAPAGRERAERVRRIHGRVELLNRKLGLAGSAVRAPAAARPRLGEKTYVTGSDTCSSAVSIGTGYFEGYTGYASNDGSSSCDGPTPSPDVWYRFTAPATGSYTFETSEYYSFWDTVLSLHSACPSGADPHELTCSDDSGATLWSSITYPLVQDEQIWVRVTGYGGATGEYELTVTRAHTVSGTVTERGTGAPIAGATVDIGSSSGTSGATVSSAPDGSYTASVPVLSYTYGRALRDGYVGQLYDGEDCVLGTFCSLYYGDRLPSTESDISGIDFSLTPAGAITGTVTASANGEPIPGNTYVYVYENDGTLLGSLLVGSGGAFEISSLPAGSYRLGASSSGYRAEIWDDVPCGSPCDVLSGSAIPVTAGSTVTGIDFTLDRLSVLGGTVTRADTEEPVGSALVVAYDDHGSSVQSDYTDSSGVFEIGYLLPDTYFLRTDTSAYLDEVWDDRSCEPGCDVTGGTPIVAEENDAFDDLDFELQPKAAISGEVTDADTGDPISVRVFLYDASGDLVTSRHVDYYDNGYSFTGLDAGTYYLRAGYAVYDYDPTHEAELYDGIACPTECDPTTGTAVVTTITSQVTGIDFELQRRGSIAGRATRNGSGDPVQYEQVKAFRLDGTVAGYASTEADGSYEIPNLVAGSYRVGTDFYDHADEMYDDVACGDPCDRTTGATVPVTTGRTTSGIDFRVDPYGSIAGACFDASTRGAIEAVFVLYDASGQQVGYDYAYNSYLIEGIPPGTYYLLARDDDYDADYQDEVYENLACDPDCDVTEGTPIEIALGTVLTGLDVYLARCPVESREEVASTTISTYFKALACDRITVTDTTLEPGADVLLRSGRSVVLGNGFSMEPGAKLRVVIDPAWKTD